MREGASSEVKYTTQSGGRTIKVNYDDLQANKGYYKRQTRNYNRQVRLERKESVERAFVTFLFIVLFTIFAGLVGDVNPPASQESVSTPQGSQDYIASISPNVGESASNSISVVLGIVEPVAKTVQWLVNGVSDIVIGTLTNINRFTGLGLGSDLTCYTENDLSFVQEWQFELAWSGYRIFNIDIFISPENLAIERASYFATWIPENIEGATACE